MKNKSLSQIFTFEKKKFIVGCLLGIVVFTICFMFYSWKAGLCFAIAFGALGGIKINYDVKFLKGIWWIWAMFYTCSVSQKILVRDPLQNLETHYVILELLCAVIVCLFVYIFVWMLEFLF